MNYQHHYTVLMARGMSRVKTPGTYLERHHIIPRCLGGSNAKSNIALLTPEEHFLAHQFLIRLHPTHRGLAAAVIFLTARKSGARVSNKLYGWLKRHQAKLMSERFVSPETRAKISAAGRKRKGTKTNGWNAAAKKRKAEMCVGTNHNQFGSKRKTSTKLKISASLTGEKHPAFGKTGEACPNFGRKHTAEQRAVTSKAMTGRKQSAETIAKRVATQARNRALREIV